MRVLIMGLPGSGKTTLAKLLFELLQNENIPVTHFNADTVRQQFGDWSFDVQGRIRQAERMKMLCEGIPDPNKIRIVDFVAPLPEQREVFQADFIIWMNTISSSRYPDTDALFVPPALEYDFRLDSFDQVDKNCLFIKYTLVNKFKEVSCQSS